MPPDHSHHSRFISDLVRTPCGLLSTTTGKDGHSGLLNTLEGTNLAFNAGRPSLRPKRETAALTTFLPQLA